MDELATVADSTLVLARYFSDSLADAYAIPDYGDEDELDILFLNDPNEALWGPRMGVDAADDLDREEGQEDE
jgi:hypothetical protein